MKFFTNGHTASSDAIYKIRTELSYQASDWIVDHPEGMIYFMERAQEFKKAGQSFGIQTLMELYRWFTLTQRQARDSEFKMNNNYGSFIARTLVLRDPGLIHLISFRKIDGEVPTFGTPLEEKV